MRALSVEEKQVVSGGYLKVASADSVKTFEGNGFWKIQKYWQQDGGGVGLDATGGLEEVLVSASKWGGSFVDANDAPGFLQDLQQWLSKFLGGSEGSARGDGGAGAGGAVWKDAEKRAADTAEKLEEVVVEASRCGMPIAELFVLEHRQAGSAWEQCFKNLSDSDKKNLKLALDTIAAGFQPSKDFNPTAIAFNAVFKEEREMLKHLANAVATNNGWQFGENLASLSKGGWDSQLILGLIKGVFKTATR